MVQAELKKIISHSLTGPGIYIFKNFKNKPLYIGKASSLRKRLLSYQKIDDQRILKMLSLAKHLKTLETDSEIEALILESQYIKKYQPTFNIMLRDDKRFGFVGLTKEEYPKIFITHQPEKVSSIKYQVLRGQKSHNTKYIIHNTDFIGPFTDMGALKTTLRYLRKIFPYCTCKKPHNNFCLNYHIGKCPGYCCLKNISYDIFLRQQHEYQKNVKALQEILSGKKISLLKKLEKGMIALGKKEKLREAIELRGEIEKIKRVFENARIIKNQDFPYYDISKNHTETALSGLKKVLGLKKIPTRIEGYDVANIQGKYAAGAMVVFENAKPNKNEYRKFKIKYWKHQKYLLQNKHDRGNIATEKNTIIDESANDTAMLKEILERRFDHPEWPMPDLILVDGGRAQLNAAFGIISKLELLISKQSQNSKFKIRNKIPIIALTKNKKHVGEKIHVAGKVEPIPLLRLPVSVKNLLLNIDSEAHRFAISYYRGLHRKTLK